MMKTHFILASKQCAQGACCVNRLSPLTSVLAATLLTPTLMLAAAWRVQAQLPPIPSEISPSPSPTNYANVPAASGQQYVVLVNGSSPLLLDQVRLVEPMAFQTVHDGRSVIQTGRYNYYENAQQQVSTLANQGIGAEIAEVVPAVPSYAQLPPSPAMSYNADGELPPLPVVALPQGNAPSSGVSSSASSHASPPISQEVAQVPALPPQSVPTQSVEFGQAPGASTGNPYMPPPPARTAAPVATPATAPTPERAPYYVIIPATESALPTISSQVIQLGTPADRVQQRLSPNGPHVAIGPFVDRGLAEQWNGFFRDAGFSASRVYFER